MNNNNYFRRILLLFSAMVLLSDFALPQQTQKLTTITKVIKVSQPENACFSLNNSSDTLATFTLSVNDNLFSSAKGITDKIRGMCKNQDSIYFYCWKFVCDNTYNFSSLYNSSWITTPTLYLNSVGYGSSEQQATILAKIWGLFGYKTQIWEFGSFFVPEVFYNDQWRMLDPTFQVYYLNAKNEIAGVDELAKNPDLITNPKIQLKTNVLSFLRYAVDVAKMFQSTDKSKAIDGDQISKDEIPDTLFFEVPPHARLQFPGVFVRKVISTKSREIPYYATCRLIIPPKWKGTVKNHLVIADIRGEGSVKINNMEYIIGDENLTSSIKNPAKFIPEIEIEDLKDTLQIIYFINPLMTEVKENNVVRFCGKKIKGLVLGSMTLADSNSVVKNLKGQYFFTGNKRVEILMNELSANNNCVEKNEVKTKEALIDKMNKYYSCIYKPEKKEYITGVLEKIKSALNELPETYDYDKLFMFINHLPQTLLFYDFEFADKNFLVALLTNLDKKK
jgi:hypothetical protein